MTDFETLRPRLLGVAYRILGSWTDAEDVVSETWLAWRTVDHTRIDSAVAYLTKAVGNRALNALRDRTRRREDYFGPWLPEPVDQARLPAEQAEIADSLSYAMLVLLEQLTPLERAAFVLCDVFGLSAPEAAEALESSPEAVRQLTSRARRHLRDRDRDHRVDSSGLDRTAREFVAALLSGDVAGAVARLSPDVVLVTDGGGRVQAALRPLEGPRKVIGFLTGLAEKFADFTIELRRVNRMPALVARPAGLAPTVFLFDVAPDGRIHRIWGVRNPEKTGAVGESHPN